MFINKEFKQKILNIENYIIMDIKSKIKRGAYINVCNKKLILKYLESNEYFIRTDGVIVLVDKFGMSCGEWSLIENEGL